MTKSSLESDTLFIVQLKQGEKNTLNKLFITYWQPLYTSAFNVLKDHVDDFETKTIKTSIVVRGSSLPLEYYQC